MPSGGASRCPRWPQNEKRNWLNNESNGRAKAAVEEAAPVVGGEDNAVRLLGAARAAAGPAGGDATGAKLPAAVMAVSPANKDRASTRRSANQKPNRHRSPKRCRKETN